MYKSTKKSLKYTYMLDYVFTLNDNKWIIYDFFFIVNFKRYYGKKLDKYCLDLYLHTYLIIYNYQLPFTNEIRVDSRGSTFILYRLMVLEI